MLIQALIVDDEQPAADKMEILLKESGIVDIKGKFTNSLTALEFMGKTHIDVAFLDIEMPVMSGIELSKIIKEHYEDVTIVFITAYDEYAVEAFRINAIDYLMKPFDRKVLKETLDRIVKQKDIRIGPLQAQIFCLGGFELVTMQDSKVEFRTFKAEELMAFFIDRRGAEISRSEITDNLWPEFDGDKAISNFNATLYYLKKALEKNGIKAPVERIKDRYKLNFNDLECDYFKFISFISSLKDIHKNNISECEATTALYKGEYLKGCEFSWAEKNRNLVREKYVSLILKMGKYYKAAKKHNKLVELLKNSIKYEPLHEGINAMLLETLMMMGDRLTAVKRYNSYKRKLKQEFGMEPNQELRKIMEKAK